jgi:hypothetical protein
MNRTLSLSLKILLGIGCFGFIFYRLYSEFTPANMSQFRATFTAGNNLALLCAATLLIILNWGIESYKWQLITSGIERISYKTAVRSVLTGLCVGNLTPGRIGEFAGRILFFNPANRSKISVTHFVCGLTQLFVTVATGICALAFVIESGRSNSTNLFLILALSTVLLVVLILLVLNINKVYIAISKWKVLSRFDLGQVTYDRTLMIRLLFFSLLRYAVFSFQYFLLLRIFGVDAEPFHLFSAIAVSFMLMSSIPMISFIEVAVRAAIAMMLFGQFQQNSMQLVGASTFLWLINIVIPSVIGYVFAVQEKFEFRSFTKPYKA